MPKKALKEFDEKIIYGNSVIPFKILLSRRRTLSIIVYRDSSVKVRAPHRASVKYIKKFVEKKAGWIKKKQDQFINSPVPLSYRRKFENDEIYNYLGKQYRLKVNLGTIDQVNIENDFLNVAVTTLNKDRVKKNINNWYQEKSREIFLERLEALKPLVKAIGIDYNEIPNFRKMRSMWGNCTRDGKIKLSYELIKTPLECIDYVIVHELCHIKEFNHGKAFYSLLNEVMPDWKFRKDKLKEYKEFYNE